MTDNRTPTSESRSPIAEQPRTYRHDRRRRHRVQTAHSKYERRNSESDLLIDLARRWLPYGGPPQEEIFHTFGINRLQYIAQLWTAVRMVDQTGGLTSELSATYPPPRPRGITGRNAPR